MLVTFVYLLLLVLKYILNLLIHIRSCFKMFKRPSELYDVVSTLICADDDTFLLIQEPNKTDYWIPSTKVLQNSWRETAQFLVKQVIAVTVTSEKLIRIYRIWVPNQASEIQFIVFKVPIPVDIKNKIKVLTLKNKTKLFWVSESQLTKAPFFDNLRSPEIQEFIIIATKGNLEFPVLSHPEGSLTYINGYESYARLVEVLENKVIIPSKAEYGGTLTAYEQLVACAGFYTNEQCKLFRVFLTHCFPCLYMNKQIFVSLMMKFGWTENSCYELFRASDLTGNGGLSYREFLYIICAVEPLTKHGGPAAEIRSRYIFRFYDRNNDSILEYSEFKSMIMAVRKIKNLTYDANSVSAEAEATIKDMGREVDKPITLDKFLCYVGTLKFRGTAALLRSPKSVLTVIKDLPDDTSVVPITKRDSDNKPAATRELDKLSTIISASGPTRSISKPCKVYEFELAVHTFTLKSSGDIHDMDQIMTIEKAVSTSSEFPLDLPSRLKSVESFCYNSISLELLRGLQYFSEPAPGDPGRKGDKQDKQKYSWGKFNSIGFANCLMVACEKAIECLKEEPRLLQLESPIYVLGDLHGNFGDLKYFENVLWRIGLSISPCNVLFLGDYVDRGEHCVEIIAYLLAYKVQNSRKIKLLRGNHEIRDIQKAFTFYTECITKFGKVLGNKIWERINQVFDHMPLAAIIDNKIFCCHGGIPPPWLCPLVSVINSIPCPLPKPSDPNVNGSLLAWELMWNDPIRVQITEDLEIELEANEGFAFNKQRATGHVFTSGALHKFMSVNGFSHVIRAHEMADAGFKVEQSGHLITVFSSSRYGKSKSNMASCILVDQNKIRMFRLKLED